MPSIRTLPPRACFTLVLSLGILAARVEPVAAQRGDSAPNAALPPGALTPEQNRLVEDGLTLRGESQDREALEIFRRAYELGADARILAQIAFAEQALGRWVASYRHLTEALADVGHPWIEANRSVLEQELETIAGNVGRLEITVSVDGAEVSVEGNPAGITPITEPLIVLPGSTTVVARAEGYLRNVRQVTVPVGGLARTEITLLPEPEPLSVASSTTSPKTHELRTRRRPAWLYVAGGGVLLAASAAIPWVVANKDVDTLKKHCPGSESCDFEEADAKHVERLDRTTNALLFSGIGVTVASTLAYVFWEEEYQAPVQVSAWGSREGAGLSTRLRF